MNIEDRRVGYVFSPYLGCDPEIFLVGTEGNIVGSEKAVPETGIKDADYGGTIIRDGVQAEFNIAADDCRARLGNRMAAAFKTLKKHLDAAGGIQASFASVVEVDQKELDTLSEKSKLLGCALSLNSYNKEATINVDPATYRKRSAGGHLHIGLHDFPILMSHREELVPILDVLVGNTSVLIDRDPHAAERRKVYGRAGEYRLPPHGVEYRTLSNFWLRAFPLMHGMMGLCRLATNILGMKYIARSDMEWDAPSELLSKVDMDSIRRAINENDLDLAKHNWEGVRTFINTHVRDGYTSLHHANTAAFDHFIRKIDEAGIEYWFPDDPMVYWTQKFTEGHQNTGWESFLTKVEGRRKADLMTKANQI